MSGAGGFRLSPDGRRLAWVGRDLQRDPEAALWIVRLADGAEAGWVGVRPPGERPFATSLDWSPDASSRCRARAARTSAHPCRPAPCACPRCRRR